MTARETIVSQITGHLEMKEELLYWNLRTMIWACSMRCLSSLLLLPVCCRISSYTSIAHRLAASPIACVFTWNPFSVQDWTRCLSVSLDILAMPISLGLSEYGTRIRCTERFSQDTTAHRQIMAK